MNLRRLRQILKVLGDDTRLRIINVLNRRELTVKDICNILKINQPAISKHLFRLRLLKIVLDRREGNFMYYRLNTDSDEGEIVKFILSRFSEVKTFLVDRAYIKKRPKNK